MLEGGNVLRGNTRQRLQLRYCVTVLPGSTQLIPNVAGDWQANLMS